MYRKRHDAPVLTLNQAMSKSAANYAKRLILLGSLDHSRQAERPGEGENIFMECSKTNLPSPNHATAGNILGQFTTNVGRHV